LKISLHIAAKSVFCVISKASEQLKAAKILRKSSHWKF